MYLTICPNNKRNPANIRKVYGPMTLSTIGNVMPTIKFPPQLQTLPSAIAIGLGPTSNSSDPIKYGIGPRPIP